MLSLYVLFDFFFVRKTVTVRAGDIVEFDVVLDRRSARSAHPYADSIAFIDDSYYHRITNDAQKIHADIIIEPQIIFVFAIS